MPENPEVRESGQNPLPQKSDGDKVQPHLRLTPEQVLENWQNRLYTPAGYLYHLILALRREGWWYRIENVSLFCRQWKINRRTFYRAKAELVVLGLLEENITGAVDLRVPRVSQIDSPVTDLTTPVTDLSLTVTDLSHSSPETFAGQGLQKATDLLQISYRSDPKERESEEFSTGNPESDQEGELPPVNPAPVAETLDDSTQAADPPEKTQVPGDGDTQFFDWVLTYKIPKLPNKPASPRCAAESWIRKQGVQLYAEYQTWLAGSQKPSTGHSGQPPPLPPPPALYETPQERLERFRQLWKTPARQKGIRKAIRDNPQWGFVIGPDGPQEKTHANP
jgi:hypothetical protein